MTYKIRRLSHALGAEIIGADLREPLTPSGFEEINRIFLEHGIVLFRGQDLTREQHIAFSERFGDLDNNDAQPRDRDPDYHAIALVTNKPKPSGKPSDSRYTGRVWHSDRSYTLIPAAASLLRAVEVPEVGGETMFTNMYLAYDTLSDGMKGMIGKLDGVYSSATRRIDDLTPERAAEMKRLNPPVAQPLVKVHPETGRKALYVGEKVKLIAGMTPEESKPLIQYLCKHATRYEFVYRHQWRKHDLLIWDNRCTMHIALGDFDETQLRHMERTTVMGTPSGYVYEGAVD
jgi:taurine dioxygenase